MAADDPDMMLWLGDNIYLREVDFQSYEGFLHRYTHARETPEMKNLLKACPNYAIWDDHDFGPNDSDGSWVHADWSREAFQTFWSNLAMACQSHAVHFYGISICGHGVLFARQPDLSCESPQQNQ